LVPCQLVVKNLLPFLLKLVSPGVYARVCLKCYLFCINHMMIEANEIVHNLVRLSFNCDLN
jgi:hypothetical protein